MSVPPVSGLAPVAALVRFLRRSPGVSLVRDPVRSLAGCPRLTAAPISGVEKAARRRCFACWQTASAWGWVSPVGAVALQYGLGQGAAPGVQRVVAAEAALLERRCFRSVDFTCQTDAPNSYRLIKRPITKSCIRSVLEKHSVRRTSRLIRVRRLICLLSIFCVFSLPT